MISDDNFGERDDIYGGIGIQYPPKICVDYLSHDWKKEDDIWASWKVMKAMSKKKEFANGVRLENASWRTWAKQKHNLKTVNPEKLNWLKDSDVTWLYGPLHTAWSNHIVSSPKSPTTEDKLNLMPSSSTKSCLKKKSIAEILRPVLGGRYGSLLVTSNSDSQLYKKDQDFEVDSDCETSSTCSSMSIGPTTPTSTPSVFLPNERSSNRKIQFNDHVEQYMAVESDEENSSDDGIVMKKDCTTITKLAPTKLKEERIHNNEYSALYTNHGRRRSKSSTSSSNSNTAPSTSTSASTSTSTSTSSPPPWADDDDDDDLYADVFDFENFDLTNPTNSSSSTQPHSSHNRIIPSYNATDENQQFHEDDDNIVDRAVNLVRWVLKARNLSLFY